MGEGYVETNGIRLWYEDRGDPDAEPIVLVMGATATVLSWPTELLDALTGAGYRVVRFDNRDIGLSTHVDFATKPYTLDDMATDTVGLLDALGIERAHFIGASMGGMISQVMALRHPDRVLSLGLLITSPGPDERLSPTSDEILSVASRPATTDAEVEQRTVDLWRALSGSRFPFDEAPYRELAALDAARGTNPNSGHPFAVFTAPSRIDALAAVTVPTLIVHGTEDPIFPIDHGEALAKAIPGSTLVTWEGVGHEIPMPLGPELHELLLANLAAAR
jgi:pimeloyl-ACP methyl ester carboxylesterase